MKAGDAIIRALPQAPYQLVLEISEQISRTVDLQDVVRHLLEAVRSVVEYDAAGIFVLNRAVPFGAGGGTDVIAAMASIGFEHLLPGQDPMLRHGKGIVGYVIRTGEVVIAADVSENSDYVEARPQTRSEIAVPIVSNSQVIGALDLECDRLDAFSTADAELLQAFAVAAAIAIEKAQLHQQVVEKHLIDQQLRIARDVQGGLLPSGSPSLPGYDIVGLNIPAWDIGGDYYDYLSLTEHRLGLVVADVSGKGVAAALLMATFRAALRSEARRPRPLAEVMVDVHHTLADSMDDSRYVTAIYGELDAATATFSYVNCGHNPPLVIQADGAWRRQPFGGRAIGMFGFAPAPAAGVVLNEGDVLALYTDGVVEASTADGAEFGDARIARVLSESAHLSSREMVDALVSATRAFTGREHYEDDFTVVVVKRC